MSLDIAYSLEIQDFLDPDRAYELYWSEILEDKTKFLCPGIDCYATVTCTNMDEDTKA